MKGVKGEVYRKEEKESRNEDVHCTVLTCNEKDKKENHSRIVPGFVIQLHENI